MLVLLPVNTAPAVGLALSNGCVWGVYSSELKPEQTVCTSACTPAAAVALGLDGRRLPLRVLRAGSALWGVLSALSTGRALWGALSALSTGSASFAGFVFALLWINTRLC